LKANHQHLLPEHLLPEHRQLEVHGPAGVDTWNLIDRSGTDPDAPVVVCVHGNPTWSMLWSRLVAELDPRYRIIAPDQLQMGYSRAADPRQPRPFAQRVEDLTALLDALEITEPVWLLGQDWGGAIAMGWAVAHRDRVAGMILSNTGIAIPPDRPAPGLIRIAATRWLGNLVTHRSPLFVRGTTRLPGLGLSRTQRDVLAAPYRRAANRLGVAQFVADVPFTQAHHSAEAIAQVAAQISELQVPVRLIWGPKDPVFDDSFAEDLLVRFADARLHRITGAGHLAVLEASIADMVHDAIIESQSVTTPDPPDRLRASLWSAIDAREHDSALAICDLAGDEQVTFEEFAAQVRRAMAHLQARRVRAGDRVAMLTPPGVDLIATVYACWRLGAVTVIADRGLGLRGLGQAVRSARVKHVIGPTKALVASRVLRWAPGANTIAVEDLRRTAPTAHPTNDPHQGDLAAVLFTSGATGPAKGVRYTHGQLAAQRDALAATYQITNSDAFVAAFAPFALYGPALGITTALPDMDVTAPATLTANALAAACEKVAATMIFASPTALANVIATLDGADATVFGEVRLVMSAGAPVPISVLRQMATVCPQAELHTPYGMTEVLPVADVDLITRERIGVGRGVCVGAAVPGCEIAVVPVETAPTQSAQLCQVDETGEVIISAAWMSQGYDRLWHTQRRARRSHLEGHRDLRWHRSGDVGHLDAEGNLWIEGRVAHLIHTAHGVVTPVPIEIAAETVPGVTRAAAVGVGPHGIAQVVLVVETQDGAEGAAPADLRDALRVAVGEEIAVAAVWTVKHLPVDIRHNAKIDRTAVAAQMEQTLAGAGLPR
jgi:acyl-coenzyme A synthetase/AMP-(fatty) acid ligase/pimeloyl-ACP methyl ester carboxylesterase